MRKKGISISFRIDEDLLEKVRSLTASSYRSIGKELNYIIKQYLQKEKEGDHNEKKCID